MSDEKADSWNKENSAREKSDRKEVKLNESMK